MANRKVPSQAASGADTFNDNLVGVQITDGSSQLTNTVFAIDKFIPEKDSKTFSTNPFSEFLSLENLKEETNAPTTQTKSQKEKSIKFNGKKDDAGKSLFGSLKSRILVSLTRIIKKFPATMMVDKESPVSTGTITASNIVYDSNFKTTDFEVETSMLYNPYDIVIKTPNSNVTAETENPLRNFYSSYKNYVIDISGVTYGIINYTEPNSQDKVVIRVNGKPFTGTTYSSNFLIRPSDGMTEEFFEGLDDLEQVLLNRETNPKYVAKFKVPRDSFDSSKTDLVSVEHNWPISRDGWNLQIVGLNYETYVDDLSDIADEIDNYKSNLMVRFMSSPQLFEFDSQDQKAESVFQLYGQSFDQVKKYIDNIAYMRNVTYDGINNLPDVLLKNLSNTLGLDTVSLFDEKSLDQTLYTRFDNQYSESTIGKNLIESEYEFYRRLLVNLAYLYKSKGTRKSIEFLLKFLGAPEPMIKLDEFVYRVTSMPKSSDLETDILNAIQGVKTYSYVQYLPSGGTINGVTYSANTYATITGVTGTTFTREGYPVDETTGMARKAFDETLNIFFEKGAGWYESTIHHRSRTILDTDNSILTGRTKTIKSKNKEFTYGEEYFDVFRTLPGLDTGFGLQKETDNIKAHQVDDESQYILNRKNISVYISSSRGLDYDIFRKSRELLLSTGITLPPQTGVTFIEFLDSVLNEQISNSNSIKYKKNYITLESIYRSYVNSNNFTPYDITTLNEYVNKISPYWTKIIDQFIPATTIWTGGNIIENGVFGRSKYQYKQGCSVKAITEELFPDFEVAIEEDLETLLAGEVSGSTIINFRSLTTLTGITYYPSIEIDGIEYGGPDYVTSGYTGITVVLSGGTSSTNSARLYTGFTDDLNDYIDNGGCTSLDSGTTLNNLPLLCNYKTYVFPDIDKVKTLWKTAVTNLVNNVVNEDGVKIKHQFYFDSNGDERIKFTSVKNGPNDCSVNDYLDYKFISEYGTTNTTCNVDTSVYADCGIFTGVTDQCILNGNVYIKFTGSTVGVMSGTTYGWPVYVHANGRPGHNENITGITQPGITLVTSNIISDTTEHCTLVLSGVTETDQVDLLFTDAANCNLKLRIQGLASRIIQVPSAPATTGFTIYPIVQYRDGFDYGLKSDTKVLVVSGATINSSTTSANISTYITNGTIVKKDVSEITTGQTILSATYKPESGFTTTDYVNANTNDNYSFSFEYRPITISKIDWLGSVKKNIITGKTSDNVTQVFETLPTTRLRVYTKYDVNEIDGGVSKRKSSFFTNRLPENLQTKPTTTISPCCNEYENGDFLINELGELIEVLEVDLDYCDVDIYYHLNITGTQPTNLIVFNGNNTHQLLAQHDYEEFDDFNLYSIMSGTTRDISGYTLCNNTPSEYLNYYDCGYGCQCYDTNPGCTPC